MATYQDLASNEEARRRALGELSRDEILKLAQTYSSEAAKRRAALTASLSDTAAQTFGQQNPKILEDLNARGLFTSPTAVSNSQNEVLKQIALKNQEQLTGFDDQTFNELNSLRGAGVSAQLQGEQDALDSGLDLNRAALEKQFQDEQFAQEQALAEKLAKEQQRNALYGSLISTGGNLAGVGLASKLLGGKAAAATALGGGGAGTVPTVSVLGGASSGGGTLAGSNLLGSNAAATGFTPGWGTVGAAGIGSMILARAAEKKGTSAFGETGGNIAGILANPIGYQLNKAKQLIEDPKKTLGKIAAPVTNLASSIGNSISHAFCFDGLTPVSMDEGPDIPINEIEIGDLTKGGYVESIRISQSNDLHDYLGVKVTGSHAVKENGAWVRVKDAYYSKPLDGVHYVYSIVTSNHRVYVNSVTFADEHENNDYENMNLEQSLAYLNQEDGLVGAN